MKGDVRVEGRVEGGGGDASPRSSRSRPSPATLLAAALAVAVFLVGVRLGSRTAGGSDSYGYVSQADLWLQGNLVVDQTWAARLASPDAERLFTPIGYRTGPRPHTIVPLYPPGLPLLMAAFSKVAGYGARYLVMPLSGALAVWLTWRLGRKALGAPGGVMAALLLACSPPFLFQTLQPMADVPATTAWLAALALVLGPPARPVLAGLAAGLGFLIRPNLAPLALVTAAVPLVRRWTRTRTTPGDRRRVRPATGIRESAWFVLGFVPGLAAYMAINAAVYGGPFTSSYGNVAGLVSLRQSGSTLAHYVGQLVDAQTLFILLVPLGCFAVFRRREATPPNRAGEDLALPAALIATLVAVLGFYAVWVRFEEWTYLRFLLPAYPAMMILGVAGLQWLLARVGAITPSRMAVRPAYLAGAICLLVAAATVRVAAEREVFDIARSESRYRRAAESVARLTPRSAVVLSMQYSGAIRYYASRVTLRYDELKPADFDRTIASLVDAGFHPYIVLEEWEVRGFRERFGASANGALDRWPIARLWPRPAVFLYDALDAGLPSRSDTSR